MDIETLIQENRHLRDQLATLSKSQAKNMQRLSDMIDARNKTLSRIIEILQPCASNRRMMQIANPARQCINLAKHHLPKNDEQ